MSEERKNEITTHSIRTKLYYMAKNDVIDTSFEMAIETTKYFEKETIASLVIPYIKKQLKNHLKMELSEDMKAYKKAIRTMLKKVKEDENYKGFSELNLLLTIHSETREANNQEEYNAIELDPFHKNNIVKPLIFNEFNMSEEKRRRTLIEELNSYEELNS